jgi:hypothetical protein
MLNMVRILKKVALLFIKPWVKQKLIMKNIFKLEITLPY